MAMMKGCVSFRTGAPITIVPKPPGEHGGGWEYVRLGKDGTFGWFPPAFVRHTDCRGSDSDDEDCASNTCSLGASSTVSLASWTSKNNGHDEVEHLVAASAARHEQSKESTSAPRQQIDAMDLKQYFSSTACDILGTFCRKTASAEVACRGGRTQPCKAKLLPMRGCSWPKIGRGLTHVFCCSPPLEARPTAQQPLPCFLHCLGRQ